MHARERCRGLFPTLSLTKPLFGRAPRAVLPVGVRHPRCVCPIAPSGFGPSFVPSVAQHSVSSVRCSLHHSVRASMQFQRSEGSNNAGSKPE
eukprot:15415507-Alexandrium_andersonii.AAC.1